mgnify:CR=1 FL=1
MGQGALKGYEWLQERLKDQERLKKVAALELVAKELNCTAAQLSIAWCLTNPFVSTVITGASRVEQVGENMKSAEIAPRLTPDILDKIDSIFGVAKKNEDDD